ncbi:acetyl-CoA carboxylase biotin carboxyl carrier protein [Thermotomaculum hydrothermale]|uniref:Biotin carboxyl carrier protein of acetyl-CoA carboxylase n=1 Tax=Thermotomaculum hydrothermale TaxID=981385 RepID=A0A7R6SYH5_9BACT|nr:acetyl-CoA carboxylase biotin carboxyl carrier protein [Thermotomaculum hydrothermale]BBB31860.1 acetyl-CoA carboxylase biotin carboxyl carrier protein [Thermotomaculum hydrothermale]
MDIKEIKQLMEAFAKNGLTKLELTNGDFSIKLKKEVSEVKVVQAGEPVHVPSVTPAKVETVEEKEEGDENLIYITSPIIGTFYRAPSPDSDPYVEVGSRVKKGDVLCIVEAMKIMNEIESEYDGVIVKIFPKNAEAVEYGQKLFALKPE